MAKGRGQITEEELASGLARVGSMSGLTAPNKGKRDNPFATVESNVESNVEREPEVKKADPVKEQVKETVKTVEVSLSSDSRIEEGGEYTEPYAADANIAAVRNSSSASSIAGRTDSPPSVRRTVSALSVAQEKQAVPTKAELYPERVTTPISQDMRAQLDTLSRELQRTRTSKGDRITSASVIRVAIQTFLESFEAAGVGGEEELLEFARKQFGLKG
jgi:hypothetical protein